MAVGVQVNGEPVLTRQDFVLWGGKPYVFVAGGLTFLGRNLIPALVQKGFGVRSMAPTIDQRAQLRSLGCDDVGYGDVHCFEAVKAAARGCQFAIHCACAIVHFDVSDNDIVFQSNNLVTSNIIKVCKALRLLKLVVQSSEAVLFDGSSLRNADETNSLPKYPTSCCPRSLQHVEKLVLSANSASLQTIVVRPRLLWGKDDEYFLPSLVRNAQSGRLRLVGNGNYLTSTCHVSNACEGIICALKNAPGGEVFFLTDGSPILFSEFVRGLLIASGVEDVDEALSRSIPMWAARKFSQLAEIVGKSLNSTPHMTQSGIGLIGQEMTFVDKKARTLIGFESTMTMEQGLEEIHRNYLRKKAKHNLGRGV